MATPASHRLSEQIQTIFAPGAAELTIRDFLDRIETRSFGILLALFAIPSALPLPAPGYSVPFGIVLFILSAQILAKRPAPWFPERILRRRLKAKNESRTVRGMTKFIRFFERFLKPRGSQLFQRGAFPVILGVVCLLGSISMLIPLPLTNTLPALGIFLMGLAMLEEDAFFGVAGLLVALVGIALTSTILFFVLTYGLQGVDMVKDAIRGLRP